MQDMILSREFLYDGENSIDKAKNDLGTTIIELFVTDSVCSYWEKTENGFFKAKTHTKSIFNHFYPK